MFTKCLAGTFLSNAVPQLLFYKLKDDKKILMDNRWVHVTDEELKAKNPIYFATVSAEIRGQNEELYGYLIYAQGESGPGQNYGRANGKAVLSPYTTLLKLVFSGT